MSNERVKYLQIYMQNSTYTTLSITLTTILIVQDDQTP